MNDGVLGDGALGDFILGGESEETPGTPARVTQELLEVVLGDQDTPDNNARVTQTFFEVIYSEDASTNPAAVTQKLLETVVFKQDFIPVNAVRVTQQTVEVLYLEPVTTDPFNDCGVFTGAQEWDARLFDHHDPNTGVRKAYGPDGENLGSVVREINFEIQDRGGYGGGNFEFLADWADSDLAGTERVDVWLWDEPAYRGYLRIAQKDLADVQSARPQLYGMVALLDQWKVKRKYAYGDAVDIVTIFRDICLDYVAVAGRFPSISIDAASPAGATLNEYDGRGKSVAQAFNELADFAPNQTIWGAEMDDARPVPGDTIYMRPRPTTTAYVVPVGDNVRAFTYPLDTHDILNSLAPLKGGTVAQENLAPNGSFEEVMPASELWGNLLLDADFEGANVNNYWVAVGGASLKNPSSGGAFGAGRSGQYWAEIDQAGEEWYQDVDCIAQEEYTAVCWARLEDPDLGNSGVLTLEGRTSAGVLVYSDFENLTGLTGTYKRFTKTIDFLAYPTVAKLRFRVTANAGSASNDGILIDDCGIYETNSVAQQYWEVAQNGDATLQSLNWASEAVTPRTGEYVIAVNPANIAVSADTIDVYTRILHAPAVLANERYTLIAWWHTDGAGTPGATALNLGATSIKSDNTQSTTWQSDTAVIANPAASTWQMISLPITTESDTVKLQLFLRIRTNETIYLDDVMLVQGEVPDEVENDGGFWPADTYQRYITVEDPLLVGDYALDADVADSIDDYGEHEDEATNDLVVDLASALTFAAGQFNAKALPKVQAGLDIYGARKLIAQEGKVRLVNLPSPPPALWPSRSSYTITGEAILCQVELGNQRPDLAGLLLLTTERARKGLT
jgi:hypothetical protein